MNTVQVIQLSDNSIYLISRNSEQLLVDTGPNYKGAWTHIQSEMKSLKPDLVFITHGHHDHASLGISWQNDAIPVWLGTADQKLVCEPMFFNPAEFSATIEWLVSAGVPEPSIETQYELLNKQKTTTLGILYIDILAQARRALNIRFSFLISHIYELRVTKTF